MCRLKLEPFVGHALPWPQANSECASWREAEGPEFVTMDFCIDTIERTRRRMVLTQPDAKLSIRPVFILQIDFRSHNRNVEYGGQRNVHRQMHNE